jgi:hypothetical protein
MARDLCSHAQFADHPQATFTFVHSPNRTQNCDGFEMGGWVAEARGYAGRSTQTTRAEHHRPRLAGSHPTLPYGSAVRDSMGSDSGTVPALWVASRGGTTCSPTASAACWRVGAMDP